LRQGFGDAEKNASDLVKMDKKLSSRDRDQQQSGNRNKNKKKKSGISFEADSATVALLKAKTAWSSPFSPCHLGQSHITCRIS